MINDIVVIRGGGDIATGIAHRLHRSGFRILVLDIKKPTVIRRTVSYAQAIYDGEFVVEGIKAVKVNNKDEIYKEWKKDNIPIIVDSQCDILEEIKAEILVDAIMAKKNLGTKKGWTPITIGVGPGFEAGKDVDVVIETNRGHFLGTVIFSGYAEENTGIPGYVKGFSAKRVIKSPGTGTIKNIYKVGDKVTKGDVIAKIQDIEVIATLSGVLRGLIMDGTEVTKGLKIGDIDPRGVESYCYTISEKARAIGGGVLEAILYLKNKRLRDKEKVQISLK